MSDDKKLAFIVLTGKPGSGKTWMAHKIAKKYNLSLLTSPPPKYDLTIPQTNESSSTPLTADEIAQQVLTYKIHPIELPEIDVEKWLDEHQYKGVVIDGSIFDGDAEKLVKLKQLYDDKYSLTHMLFILNLKISDNSILNRRISQWIDPQTGLIYREEQLLATPMKFSIQESVIENKEDDELEIAVDNELPNMPFYFMPPEPVDLTDLEKIMALEEGVKWMDEWLKSNSEEDANEEMMAKRNRYEAYLHNYKYFENIEKPVTWNKISLDIRQRLRKRSRDDESSVLEELQKFQETMIDEINTMMISVPKYQCLELNAAQTPLEMLFMVWLWMEISVSRYVVLFDCAKPIDLPMDSVKGLSPEKALVRLLESKGDGWPPLKMGNIANNCIVSYVDKGTITAGDPYFSMAYKGILFVFANHESKVKFTENYEFYYDHSERVDPIPLPLDIVDPDFFNAANVFGFCKDYCVVSLKDGILKKGDTTIAAIFSKRYYLFANEDYRRKFLESPFYYIENSYFTISCPIPPPKIAISGASGSGKTCLHTKFAGHLPLISFNNLVKRYLTIVKDEEIRRDIVNQIDICEELKPEVLDSIFSLEQATFSGNAGFVLEGFPRNKQDADYLVKNNSFHVDLMIYLNANFEAVEKRVGFDSSSNRGVVYEDAILKDRTERLNAAMEEVMADNRLKTLITVASFDANRSLRKVYKDVESIFYRFVKKRELLFCQAHLLSSELMENISTNAMAHRSSYGALCPVTLSSQHRHIFDCLGKIPVMIFDKIYFCRNSNCVKAITLDPLQYIDIKFPKEMQTPIFTIYGEENFPICKRLALDLNMKFITTTGAFEIAQKQKDEFSHLKLPDDPDSMTIDQKYEVLKWVFHEALPSSRGIITNAIFSSKEEYEKFSSSFMPWKIFEITGRMRNEVPEAVKAVVLKDYLNSWKELPLDAKTIRNLKQEILTVTHSRYYHQCAIEDGFAALCSESGLTRKEYLEKIPQFGSYCPVNYCDEKELISNSDVKNLIRFEEFIYSVYDHAAAKKFLSNPKLYTSDLALPEAIAKRIDAALVNQLAFKGYCPVSFCAGKIVPGKLQHLAEYSNSVFAMCSEEYAEKFIAAPWKYALLSLPENVPPATVNIIHYGNLPFRSYIDETLSAILNQTLLYLAKLKPKIPHQNMRESAICYVYLYLKANNPNLNPILRAKYESKLNKFIELCESFQEIAIKAKTGELNREKLPEQWKNLIYMNPNEAEKQLFASL